MRNCQICGDNGKRELFHNYDSMVMNLYECCGCGHRYVDNADLSQAWFDRYYLTQYTTSDTPYSFDRYSKLAWFVASRASDVLDIGGKNGELHEHFANIQSLNYEAVGVGEKPVRQYGCVVLSHTLEHVYELAPLFEMVRGALLSGGLLVVEVPVHLEYVGPKEVDYHWQHCNKFRPQDLKKLFEDNQFRVTESSRIDDYLEYRCWRIAGRKVE